MCFVVGDCRRDELSSLPLRCLSTSVQQLGGVIIMRWFVMRVFRHVLSHGTVTHHEGMGKVEVLRDFLYSGC